MRQHQWGKVCILSALAAAPAGVLCGLPAKAQEAPQDIIARWIADADKVENLSVTHGGIDHDAGAGTTTVRDLKLAFETPAVKTTNETGEETSFSSRQTYVFPQIRFNSFVIDGAYYKASSIEAQSANFDMTVDAKPQGASKTTGTYKAFRVDNPRWARLPEVMAAPDAPVSSYYQLVAALVDVSFDGMKLDGVEATSVGENPKMEFKITYGPTAIGRAERGDFSEIKAEGFAMSVRTEVPDENGAPKAQDVDVTGGTMIASNYNYGTLVRAFDPAVPAGSADAPYQTLIGKVEMPDIRFVGDGFQGRVGRLAMENIGVRTPTVPVLKRADAMLLASQTGTEPSEQELLELVFGAYGAFSLGSMGAYDIAFDAPEASTSFKLGSYEIRGLSSKGFGGYEVKGLDFTGPEGVAFKVGRVAVSDIGFPDLKALLNIETAQQAGDYKAIMAAIPTLGSIVYEGIDVKVPNIAEFSLAKGLIEMAGHIGPIPTRMQVDVQNFAMVTTLLPPEDRKPFEELGYDRIDASARVAYAWDEATQKINVETSAKLADGGTLEAKADLGGLPKFAFEDPLAGAIALTGMNFVQASATYTDASLKDRLLTAAAKQQGTDATTLKAQAVGALPFVMAELNRPQFMTMVTEAAKAFLDGKNTLSATGAPPAPVPLALLMSTVETDPGAILDKLAVTVTAQ